MSPYIIPGLKRAKINFSTTEASEQNFKRIIDVVLSETGVTESELREKRRFRELVELRMISMWAIRNNTSATWKNIGKYFNRDHSTVINAYNTIKELMDTNDRSIMGIVERVRGNL